MPDRNDTPPKEVVETAISADVSKRESRVDSAFENFLEPLRSALDEYQGNDLIGGARREKLLSGEDGSVVLNLQFLLRRAQGDLELWRSQVEKLLNPEELAAKNIPVEQQGRIGYYPITALAERLFFENQELAGNNYGSVPPEQRLAANSSQRRKRELAWQYYQQYFGNQTPGARPEQELPYSVPLRDLQLRLLHQFMESALDPDFGDPVLAKEIFRILDVPEERAVYGTEENLRTLREVRLARYDAPEANCLPADADNSGECVGKEELENFIVGRHDIIKFGHVEVSQEEFNRLRAQAEIRVDTSGYALAGIIMSGRFQTIHENNSARAEWERATPGYHSRREGYEDALGIRAKGTPGDEHVISGYLAIPELQIGPRPGHYGHFSIRLKRETIERSGFTQRDSVRTSKLSNPGRERMNFNTAVIFSAERAAVNKETQGYQHDYIEAQVFGGLTVDDIEDIAIAPVSRHDLHLVLPALIAEISVEKLRETIERFPKFKAELSRIARATALELSESEVELQELQHLHGSENEKFIAYRGYVESLRKAVAVAEQLSFASPKT